MVARERGGGGAGEGRGEVNAWREGGGVPTARSAALLCVPLPPRSCCSAAFLCVPLRSCAFNRSSPSTGRKRPGGGEGADGGQGPKNFNGNHTHTRRGRNASASQKMRANARPKVRITKIPLGKQDVQIMNNSSCQTKSTWDKCPPIASGRTESKIEKKMRRHKLWRPALPSAELPRT